MWKQIKIGLAGILQSLGYFFSVIFDAFYVWLERYNKDL